MEKNNKDTQLDSAAAPRRNYLAWFLTLLVVISSGTAFYLSKSK